MSEKFPEEKYSKKEKQPHTEGIEFIGEVEEAKEANLEKYVTARYKWITESRHLLKEAEDIIKDPNLTAEEKERRVMENIKEATKGLDEKFDISER